MTETTQNKDYTTALAEHQADKTLDKTATGGDSLFAKDAANKALEAFDPQPHPDSTLPVLSPAHPNLETGTAPALQEAVVVSPPPPPAPGTGGAIVDVAGDPVAQASEDHTTHVEGQQD